MRNISFIIVLISLVFISACKEIPERVPIELTLVSINDQAVEEDTEQVSNSKYQDEHTTHFYSTPLSYNETYDLEFKYNMEGNVEEFFIKIDENNGYSMDRQNPSSDNLQLKNEPKKGGPGSGTFICTISPKSYLKRPTNRNEVLKHIYVNFLVLDGTGSICRKQFVLSITNFYN